MKSTTPSRLHLCRRFSGAGVQQTTLADDVLRSAGFPVSAPSGGNHLAADRRLKLDQDGRVIGFGVSASSDGDRSSAIGADQGIAKAQSVEFVDGRLQHELTPFAKAALTDVVRRLKDAWHIGPAQCWDFVHLQRKVAVSEFDHRVSRAVIQCFFQAGNLFSHLQILLQELSKGSVVSNKCILGIEKVLHEPLCSFADDGDIPRRYGRLTNLDGTSDGRDRG